ncbi:MAG TPA: hypothetical protein VF611_03510 [Pyrinomonadaceae bacterium]
MKAKLALCVLAAALACASPARAAATTWFPQEFSCPACKTKNTFLVVASYGSYIYDWPSKYEFVFWPLTDSASVYTCKRCRLSAFMWDFEATPKEKHAEILKRLEGFRLDHVGPPVEHYEGVEYTRIPMTRRLLAAEQTYQVLGRDDDFWCRFYRTLGHHHEAEKNRPQADEARRKALSIAERMLADKSRAGGRKELLLISGAMRHFLKDDPGALKDFREAQGLRYVSKEAEEEKSKNYDEYLTALLGEYVEMLGGKGGKKPGA